MEAARYWLEFALMLAWVLFGAIGIGQLLHFFCMKDSPESFIQQNREHENTTYKGDTQHWQRSKTCD